MKKGEFTVEKVEGALRRIFGEKSKKEISGNMEDPNREGGQLFRTNVKTAPGANKKARKAKQSAINTIKAVVKDGEKRLNEQGQTPLEEDIDYAEDVRHLACDEEGNVPMSDREGQTLADLEQIEREGLAML
ncbi:hypothetical protein PF005_g16944 [Phytophthora fragariae]|uniref:Uncharacterized protein n=2 Tax=Phytophthora fragariae TaxID=53985 RepID=A0A6A3Y5G7_9STRA|nr:hypothetical protein PF011_g2632 [Phytophthora fragariae]KAE9196264.1 hypothetical protein PF005_g16944 [Phytophthora fragariae]KAE9199379.1 hypothetical protein PF004_g19287 [Phytophthora fragariae]KAE9212522.1 hypothetical protein PF002_g18233 [Phytophthora fragariae]